MTGKRKIVPRVRARHQPSPPFKTRRTRRHSMRKPTSHKLVRRIVRQGFARRQLRRQSRNQSLIFGPAGSLEMLTSGPSGRSQA